MGSRGLILLTGLMKAYSTMAGKLTTTPPPYSLNLMPSDLYLFDSIKKHLFACNLQQMLFSKLSSSGFRHLILVSSVIGYKFWYHGATNT
jgi:hypothetical protein